MSLLSRSECVGPSLRLGSTRTLRRVLRHEVERGRVVETAGAYRLVPDKFSATTLQALAALEPG